MKIKPFKDLIEPEAEKTQSFIYEFLSYITLIEEFRTQSNIQDGTFVKIFNGVVVLSLFLTKFHSRCYAPLIKLLTFVRSLS